MPAPFDPLRRGPARRGRPRRRHHHRHHRVHAHGAAADRSHRRAPQGPGRRPGPGHPRLGHPPRQRRLRPDTPVRDHRARQRARVLEPRTNRHRTAARHGRSLAGPGRRRLVAHLPLPSRLLRPGIRRHRNPQQDPRHPGRGGRRLAGHAAHRHLHRPGASANPGPDPARHRRPLRRAHRQRRRHAARIPMARRVRGNGLARDIRVRWACSFARRSPAIARQRRASIP